MPAVYWPVYGAGCWILAGPLGLICYILADLPELVCGILASLLYVADLLDIG